MLALTLTLLLAAEPAEPERQTVVFLQPAPTVLGAILRAAVVSGGAQHHLTGDWGFTFDVSLGLTSRPVTGADTSGSAFVALSGGPTLRLLGAGFNGLFFTPKAHLVAARNSWERGESPLLGGARGKTWASFEAGLGADLAAQWTVGRFFIGGVVGGSVGWLFEEGSDRTPWLTVDTLPFELRREGSGLALAVNLQVRVGFTF